MSSKWAEINCAQSREKYLTTISLSTICLEILGNSPLGKMHHHSSQVAWIGFSIFMMKKKIPVGSFPKKASHNQASL